MTAGRESDPHESSRQFTPIPAVLAVTALASVGTGVFWSAIAFIAQHSYEFSERRNLFLAAVMGFAYMIGAFNSGRILRWCERWWTPRAILLGILTSQALLCGVPALVSDEWGLWLTMGGSTITYSILWPLVESYVTSGRHGPAMRSAIGWFNLVWMIATAVPLLVMPPLLEHHAKWVIFGQAALNLITLVPILSFAPRPGHHEAEISITNVPERYSHLLRSMRLLLPLSYLLYSVLNPIIPYLLDRLAVSVELKTPATATWMLARAIAGIIMWRVGFWHGRWGTLLLASAAMCGGFAMILLAPSMGWMMSGFVIFGSGMGMMYYAALYYAMAVGRAAVDAGGTHEALIGAGYASGPLIGLAAHAMSPAQSERYGIIVGIAAGFSILSGIVALKPYLRERRLQRGDKFRSS